MQFVSRFCFLFFLRRKLHQKLPSVRWDSNLSRNSFVAASVAEEKLDSTFRNEVANDFMDFLNVAQCNTAVQFLLQCFARSANRDPYYPLLGPPRSTFCELLAVPLHSVTALFVQLQFYAFKTSCTQNCLVQRRLYKTAQDIHAHAILTYTCSIFCFISVFLFHFVHSTAPSWVPLQFMFTPMDPCS